MVTFFISCIFSSVSFFSVYRTEAKGAIGYFNNHPEIEEILGNYLSAENVIRAKSIVAPEVAMYSRMGNILEYSALNMLYIQFGTADYSIGTFQMKPSFAELIERRVKTRKLASKYKLLRIYGKNSKMKRKIRLDRLMSVRWQCIYLSAFVDIVSDITKDSIVNVDDELKYWATYYNSGIELNKVNMLRCMERKLFPKRNQFNYSEVAKEFYGYFKGTSK